MLTAFRALCDRFDTMPLTGLENTAAWIVIVLAVSAGLGGFTMLAGWIWDNLKARVDLRETSSFSLPDPAPAPHQWAPPSFSRPAAKGMERTRREQQLQAVALSGSPRVIGRITPMEPWGVDRWSA